MTVISTKNNSLDLLALAEEWWADLDLMESTRSQYFEALQPCIRFLGARNVAGNPQRIDLLEYKRHLKGRGFRLSTQNTHITAARRFFHWLHRNGHYSIDPASDIKCLKLGDAFLKDALTPKQGKDLVESIDPTDSIAAARDYAIVNLQIRTGIRRSSVWSADICDMRTMGEREVLFIRIKGTEDKSTYVVLTSEVAEPIHYYLSLRHEVRPKDSLFVGHGRNNNGQRLSLNYISALLKWHLKEIGLTGSRYSCHSLRHSAISYLASTGATTSEIMSMSKHRDPKMAHRYIHNFQRLSHPAEHRINQVLKTRNALENI